jgi:hypothetical protein
VGHTKIACGRLLAVGHRKRFGRGRFLGDPLCFFFVTFVQRNKAFRFRTNVLLQMEEVRQLECSEGFINNNSLYDLERHLFSELESGTTLNFSFPSSFSSSSFRKWYFRLQPFFSWCHWIRTAVPSTQLTSASQLSRTQDKSRNPFLILSHSRLPSNFRRETVGESSTRNCSQAVAGS